VAQLFQVHILLDISAKIISVIIAVKKSVMLPYIFVATVIVPHSQRLKAIRTVRASPVIGASVIPRRPPCTDRRVHRLQPYLCFLLLLLAGDTEPNPGTGLSGQNESPIPPGATIVSTP